MPPDASDGGPAAGVRWNLSDLYESPDDPRIDEDLALALEGAGTFADHYRERMGALAPGELAGALDELEALQEPVVRAGAYSGLLFAADTGDPRHGALLQRVQEKATEIRNTLLFFELEWVSLDDAAAAALTAAPELAKRRHFLQSMRRYKPHVLSEPEERILAELSITGKNAFSRLFDELMGAIDRALGLYDDRQAWKALVQTGMKQDWSWKRSAQEYADLYTRAAAKRQEAPVSA